MMSPESQIDGERNIAVVAGILKAVNDHDYEVLNRIMDVDFRDHHPGIGDSVVNRESYVQALEYVHSTLDMKARVDLSFADGHRVVTRVTLTGKHIGPFMGISPTGREVEWTTIEVYRVEDGRIHERWALDDMVGLLAQLGVQVPA
jgi:predicted ester cyclase